jgi:peptide/nickel transport system substrate-binding protein
VTVGSSSNLEHGIAKTTSNEKSNASMVFHRTPDRAEAPYAIPYQKITDAVLFGEAKPLFGAASKAPSDATWPSPTVYQTDLSRAKTLLAEAGMAEGFETTISLDAGQAALSEPIAVLVQESLAVLNIRTTIDKIPGSNWRGEMMKKRMPFMINFFSGWLDYPEYFFFFTYHGQNAVFNTMSYKTRLSTN